MLESLVRVRFRFRIGDLVCFLSSKSFVCKVALGSSVSGCLDLAGFGCGTVHLFAIQQVHPFVLVFLARPDFCRLSEIMNCTLQPLQ